MTVEPGQDPMEAELVAGARDVRAAFATRVSRFKRLASHDYRQSVFRRSTLLLLLLVPAYGANLAVMYVAADLMSVERFGVFYVAVTLSNILFSGSFVLNLFFTRDLVSVAQGSGDSAIFSRLLQVERVVTLWGGAVFALIFLVMVGASTRLGVQSAAIILFIVLDAYTAYVAELGRVMLQSQHRTLLLGSYTLIWMVLRFVLCVIGILVFGTVSGALCGTVAATIVTYGGFRVWIARRARGTRAAELPLPKLMSLVPAVFGYGTSIVISNLDVLLAYLVLTQVPLGVYSASSIFPKAMLVVLTPLLQMLFPMLIGNAQSRSELLIFLGKIGLAVLILAGAGAAVLWALSPWVCGGPWGMPQCSPPLLHILLLSVVPLVLLRLLVLLGFARGREWLAAWLILPTVIYLWIAVNAAPQAMIVAKQFTVFAAIAFALLFLASLLAARARVTKTAQRAS